jgi:predicted membrane protein
MGTPVPSWLYSWQMLLIAIGFVIGLTHNFRGTGWFVPMLVGGLFLLNEYVWDNQLHGRIWPLILIIVGVMFIVRPRQRRWDNYDKKDEKKNTAMNTGETSPEPNKTSTSSEGIFSEDDYLDTTSIFGGTEKVVLSKNFKGGRMTNIFGGSEINLTKADINGTAVLDVTAMFGGASLIVPSNWAVKSEAMTIFGGISDKRSVSDFPESSGKNLLIKGTIIFGGLEIKSF